MKKSSSSGKKNKTLEEEDDYESSSIDSVSEALKKKMPKSSRRSRKRPVENKEPKKVVAETEVPKITSFFQGRSPETKRTMDENIPRIYAKKKAKVDENGTSNIVSITIDKMKGVSDNDATHHHETLDIPDFRSHCPAGGSSFARCDLSEDGNLASGSHDINGISHHLDEDNHETAAGNQESAGGSHKPVFNEKNMNRVKEIATMLRHGNLALRDTRTFADHVFERDVKPFIDAENDDNAKDNKPWASTLFMNPVMFNVVRSMLTMYSPKKCNARDSINEMRKLKKIEGTDMKWDNQFCTIASGQERPCVSGKECIAFKKMGFICKEFLTPTEHEEIMQTHTQNSVVKPCLFCISQTCMISSLLKKVNDVEDRQTTSTYQPHFSIVNVEGSYQATDCIPITNTCFFHMVANHWSKMVPIIKDGAIIGVVRKGYLKYTNPVHLSIGPPVGGRNDSDDDNDGQNF